MKGRGLVQLLLACGLLLACVSAEAQEPRQDRRFGITVGYPGSSGVIGLVWQTSNRTAFRPEFSFSTRFAGEGDTGDTTTGGITVTVLRYIARKDGVSAYVGPRFTYGRGTTRSNTAESVNSSYGAAAAVGLQYELTRRIGVYGEVGAGYAYAKNTSTTGTYSMKATTHSISSRGGLGLNLYF